MFVRFFIDTEVFWKVDASCDGKVEHRPFGKSPKQGFSELSSELRLSAVANLY